MTAATAKADPHPDLVMTRIYEAPRQLVWDAITQADHLAQWFGPHGFTRNTASVDLRTGGAYRVMMARPGAAPFEASYTITGVEPIDRLTLETARGNHDANNFHRVRLTFELSERGTQTILTLTGQVLEAQAKAMGPLAGPESAWSQSLERLAGALGCLVIDAPAAEPRIVISRMFNASRELIWEALSKPEHLRHWWGPHGTTNPVCEMDFRVDGAWRITQRSADGREHTFMGKYLEIDPPETVVQTFGMEGMFEGSEMVERMTLTPLGDVTLLQVTSTADTLEARNGMLESGMSLGANQTYERLESYVAKLR